MDPTAAWLRLLEPLRTALVKDGGLDEPAAAAVFAALASWMTGALAAALVLQVLLGLFIGRWWQRQFYNPGGFGADFHSFQLHLLFGLVGLLLVAAVGFQPGPGLIPDLLLVLSILWLFQGLAAIYQLIARRGLLVGLYMLLVVFMPRTLVLVACLGLVDIWVDLRAHLGPQPPA